MSRGDEQDQVLWRTCFPVRCVASILEEHQARVECFLGLLGLSRLVRGQFLQRECDLHVLDGRAIKQSKTCRVSKL